MKSDLIRHRLKWTATVSKRLFHDEAEQRLENVLTGFACQEVPECLFKYAAFRDKYVSDDPEATLANIAISEGRVRTPLVVSIAKEYVQPGTKSISEGYLNPFVTVAYGFKKRVYTPVNEVVWIVDILPTSSPVTSDEIEHFQEKCLETKKNLEGVEIVKWIIGKDAFSPESLRLAEKYEMYSSTL